MKNAFCKINNLTYSLTRSPVENIKCHPFWHLKSGFYVSIRWNLQSGFILNDNGAIKKAWCTNCIRVDRDPIRSKRFRFCCRKGSIALEIRSHNICIIFGIFKGHDAGTNSHMDCRQRVDTFHFQKERMTRTARFQVKLTKLCKAKNRLLTFDI